MPYLTHDAVWTTLGYVAGLRGGGEIVFDYTDPPDTLSGETRARHDTRAARLAALGESLIASFEPATLAHRLRLLGFTTIEDLGPERIAARYFAQNASAETRGGHFLLASTPRGQGSADRRG